MIFVPVKSWMFETLSSELLSYYYQKKMHTYAKPLFPLFSFHLPLPCNFIISQHWSSKNTAWCTAFQFHSSLAPLFTFMLTNFFATHISKINKYDESGTWNKGKCSFHFPILSSSNTISFWLVVKITLEWL